MMALAIAVYRKSRYYGPTNCSYSIASNLIVHEYIAVSDDGLLTLEVTIGGPETDVLQIQHPKIRQ